MALNLLPPSIWIERFADSVPAGGSVLDLACGAGRHGRVFLERGHKVAFLDIDTQALGARRFDAVIVINYLWRPILRDIVAAVALGGVLMYETFAVGNEAFGRPRNPDHLLRSGELLESMRGHLKVLAYEQCLQDRPSRRVMQHIVAMRET